MRENKKINRFIPLIIVLFLIIYSYAKYVRNGLDQGFTFGELLGIFFNWMNVFSLALALLLPFLFIVATKKPSRVFLIIVITISALFGIAAIGGGIFLNAAKAMTLSEWGQTLYTAFQFLRGSGLFIALSAGNTFGALTEILYIVNYYIIVVFGLRILKEDKNKQLQNK